MTDFVVTEIPAAPASTSGNERFDALAQAGYEAFVKAMKVDPAFSWPSWADTPPKQKEPWLECAKAIAARLALR
jgi:hypothetical protein